MKPHRAAPAPPQPRSDATVVHASLCICNCPYRSPALAHALHYCGMPPHARLVHGLDCRCCRCAGWRGPTAHASGEHGRLPAACRRIRRAPQHPVAFVTRPGWCCSRQPWLWGGEQGWTWRTTSLENHQKKPNDIRLVLGKLLGTQEGSQGSLRIARRGKNEIKCYSRLFRALSTGSIRFPIRYLCSIQTPPVVNDRNGSSRPFLSFTL